MLLLVFFSQLVVVWERRAMPGRILRDVCLTPSPSLFPQTAHHQEVIAKCCEAVKPFEPLFGFVQNIKSALHGNRRFVFQSTFSKLSRSPKCLQFVCLRFRCCCLSTGGMNDIGRDNVCTPRQIIADTSSGFVFLAGSFFCNFSDSDEFKFNCSSLKMQRTFRREFKS